MVKKKIGELLLEKGLISPRQLTSILEPILTLVVGVFVLILALAIFLPMWNLISVFKGS
jgi:type II secretory pathway component PulF